MLKTLVHLGQIAIEYVCDIKYQTNTKATADKKFSDCHFDISENSRRLMPATLKTYEQTGRYLFLKVFKKTTEDADF